MAPLRLGPYSEERFVRWPLNGSTANIVSSVMLSEIESKMELMEGEMQTTSITCLIPRHHI